MEIIAVFVNGSEEAAASLEFGTHEAAIRRARLRLVAAWDVPSSILGGGVAGQDVYDEFRESAEALIQEAVAQVATWDPSVEVETRVVKGQPGPVFLEESRDAALIVAARKRHAGIKELVLGSVSKHILNNSERPVVVIPILPRS
jgi:nucleotide-binding universal stress UspA family protein